MAKQINIGIVTDLNEVATPPAGKITFFYMLESGETVLKSMDDQREVESLTFDAIEKQDAFWQSSTTTSADRYPINARVNDGGVEYVNLTGVNTDTPPSADFTNWKKTGSISLSNNYIVDKNGDDTANTGQNYDSPFKTIQKALLSVAASQGKSIRVNAGSYTENIVFDSSQNINLTAEYTPTDARITELVGDVVIQGTNATRVRISNLILNNMDIVGTQGRHYFKNIGVKGILTVTATTNWVVIEDSYINELRIPNDFAGVIYFIRCTFEGGTMTLNNASPLQVVLLDCSSLPSLSLSNCVYSGTNYDVTEISRHDTSSYYMTSANEITDVSNKKLVLRDDATGKLETFDSDGFFAKETVVWAYQDFNNVTGTSLTINKNSNATTPISGASFDTTKIISNSVQITLQNGLDFARSSSLLGLVTNIIDGTNTQENITISSVPRTEDQNIRVWYKYKVGIAAIPDGYSEAPVFVKQAYNDALDKVFATDESVDAKQDAFWRSSAEVGTDYYDSDYIVNYAGKYYKNKTGVNGTDNPETDSVNWELASGGVYNTTSLAFKHYVASLWGNSRSDVVDNISEVCELSDGSRISQGLVNFESHGYTIGKYYYLTSTSGTYTNVEPINENEIVQRLFYVVDADTLLIDIQDWYFVDKAIYKTNFDIKAIYHNGTSYALAQANSSTTLAELILVGTTTTESKYKNTKVRFSTTHSFGDAGDVLYLSSTTAGELTNVEPTGASEVTQVLGYVVDDKTIHINIQDASLFGRYEFVQGTMLSSYISLPTGTWNEIGSLTIPSDGVWDVYSEVLIRLGGGGVNFLLKVNGVIYNYRGEGAYSGSPAGTLYDNGTTHDLWTVNERNMSLSSGDIITLEVIERVGGSAYVGDSYNNQFNAKKVAGYLPVTQTTADISDIIPNADSGYIDIGNMRMAWGSGNIGNPLGTVTFPVTFSATPNITFSDGLDNSSSRYYNILTKSATGFTARCFYEDNTQTTGAISWIAIGKKP